MSNGGIAPLVQMKNNLRMKFHAFTFITVKRRWSKLAGTSFIYTTNILLEPGNFGA
jgi:hypothetical protein